MYLISPMYRALYLWSIVYEILYLISPMYRALHLWSMVGLRRRLEIRSRIWSTLQLLMLTLWWFSSMLCILRVCWSLNYWYNLIVLLSLAACLIGTNSTLISKRLNGQKCVQIRVFGTIIAWSSLEIIAKFYSSCRYARATSWNTEFRNGY